jgi:hypothetical protein
MGTLLPVAGLFFLVGVLLSAALPKPDRRFRTGYKNN